ncbi:MAG: hypothetical protein ACRC3B_00600, partial [Bacteroidia bacterium]
YDNLSHDRMTFFWKNDSLIFTRTQTHRSFEELESGLWINERYTNGTSRSYLIRYGKKDTVHMIVNGKSQGPVCLFAGPNMSLWANYVNDSVTSLFVEDLMRRKRSVSVYDSSAGYIEFTFSVSEKALIRYDHLGPAEYVYQAFSALNPGSRMHIIVRGSRNSLLCEAYGYTADSGRIVLNTDSAFCNSVFDGFTDQKFVFDKRTSVTGYYNSRDVAFVLSLKNDSVAYLNDYIKTKYIISKTIYYKNGKRALFTTEDSLIAFNRRGKPVTTQNKDSITVYRNNGSQQFFLKSGYRNYMDKRGRIVFERFGDSLVRYEKSGKLEYYALIKNDSVTIHTNNGELTYSGALATYFEYGRRTFFEVLFKQEAKTEEDILFMLLHEKMLFNVYRSDYERIPNGESFPDNPYFRLGQWQIN